MKKSTTILMITAVLMFGLFGCAKKYSVDYCGAKKWYAGAKDSYKAGATVHLEYAPIATDVDYHFYVNVDSFRCDLDNRIQGYVVEFVMPEHDVKVECEMTGYPEFGG